MSGMCGSVQRAARTHTHTHQITRNAIKKRLRIRCNAIGDRVQDNGCSGRKIEKVLKSNDFDAQVFSSDTSVYFIEKREA